MAKQNKKSVAIFVGIIALILVVVAIVCFSCAGSQNQIPSSDTAGDVIPSDDTSGDASSDDSADADTDDSGATVDYQQILDEYAQQLSEKATSLADDYEQAKFVQGKSDAELSQLASDSYDALKSVYTQGTQALTSQKTTQGGSDAGLNQAISQLEQTYNNQLQHLKDDIANLNS